MLWPFIWLLLFSLVSEIKADDRTLRIAANGLPPEKGNPFSNTQTPSIYITGGIFDGLTRLQANGKLIPWLATSWRNIDPLTWEFTLRQDVVFSNGYPFNAEAIVTAVDYLVKPGPAIEGVRRNLSLLAGAQARSKHVVEIITRYPVPNLPQYMVSFWIPEPNAWLGMEREEFFETPIGTGPFRMVNWEPHRATLVSVPTSWRTPKVEGLEVLIIPDPSARIQALQSNRIDITLLVTPDDIDSIEAVGGRVISWIDASVSGIFLKTKQDTPLGDVRVRRALNMAVDRQTIIDLLLGGQTVLSGQPAVRNAFGHNPTIAPYPYDPEAASALLAEAGYADGFSFTVETSLGGTNGSAVIQRVANDLRKIGIIMNLRVLPTIAFLANFARGLTEGDAFTMIWPAYPVLDTLQTMRLHSCLKPDGWYCDKRIMPFIKAAQVEWDKSRAMDLRKSINRFYHDEAPSIFLYETVFFAGLSKRIRGFNNTFGYINYDEIEFLQ